MRCPHCAGEIPDGSRFCGICGRAVDPEGLAEPGAVIAPSDAAASRRNRYQSGLTGTSMSLFELPGKSRARTTRLMAVLGLDLVLAGAGVAMILSYIDARGRAGAPPPAPVRTAPPSAEIEILPPEPVGPAPEARSQPPAARPSPRPSGPAAPVVVPGADAGAGLQVPPIERRGSALVPDAAVPPPPAAAADAAAAPPPPVVDAGDAEVTTGSGLAEGPLDDASMEALTRQIALVVGRNEAQLQRCYRQVAKASGPVQGRIVIGFELQPEGRATGVTVEENTTGAERLGQCVAALFVSMPLPGHEAAGAIGYRWPVVFKIP